MGQRRWRPRTPGRARSLGLAWAGAALLLTSYGAAAPAVAAPTCAGLAATIVGTSGADVLEGTAGPDVIVARGGADVVRAGAGNDVVCAGSGDDTVFAGKGADLVLGEGGADTLDPGPGRDDLDGGDAVDTLRIRSEAGATIDLVRGTVTGAGGDSIAGFEIVDGAGSGSFTVNTGVDTMAVVLAGDHADTVLTAQVAGAVPITPLTLALGLGADVYLIRQPGVVVVEDLPGTSGGRDQVDVAADGTTVIHDGADGLRVDGSGQGRELVTVRSAGSPVYLDTGAGDDTLEIVATSGSVVWRAGPGDDLLSGSLPAFADIDLGPGSDTITALQSLSDTRVVGGAGLDTLLGGEGRDDVDLVGHWWRWGGHSVAIGGFERLLGDRGDDALRGDSRDNVLLGGPGDDLLNGRSGSDELDGQVGSDTAKGGPGDDWCHAELKVGCERR